MHSLEPVVIVLFLAVLVVIVCRVIKIPAMLGYLVVGFLAGSGVLDLIPDSEETAFLGEIGIVFMMFTIGLEFSLPKLRAMRQLVFGVGLVQVLVTMLVVGVAVLGLGGNLLGSFAVAGALTMSSTAIVSRMLNERAELSQPHGQISIGVLLFQDIAVVPLLILLPAFTGGGEDLWWDLGLAAVKVVVVLVLLLYFGQQLVRPWFALVARQRSSELFMINVLLVTLGIAWLTDLSGLSLALGAFLAGMLISETEYRYQVEEDIRPFRDILLGFFFITVGMKLDPVVLMQNYKEVLLLLVLLIPVKLAIVFGASRLFKRRANESLRASWVLAQGGEFGFVLIALSLSLNIMPSATAQAAIAAILVSMLCAPFLIMASEGLTRRLIRSDWDEQAVDLHDLLVRSMNKNDHILICGYSRSGQAVARIIEAEEMPFFALDLDPERVKEASEAGDPVVFGDAAKHEVLIAAGIMRAKSVVLTISQLHDAIRIIKAIHQIRPALPIIALTPEDSNIEKLREAGADEVIAEVMEGSLMLASHALMVAGISPNRVLHRIRAIRKERYALFKGYFRGITDEADMIDENIPPRLFSVQVYAGAAAIGKSLEELALESHGVEVKVIRRNKVKRTAFDRRIRVEQDDILVLLGTPDQLAWAEARILQGE